jgi:leucyl/phenylalanyl-tRNA--protein transferase
MQLDGMELFDVQWLTDHLASLGGIAIPRQEYLARLAHAVAEG